MSNPLRKTLEFLGLAEESYGDHLDRRPSVEPTQAKSAQRATVTPLRRSSRSQGASDVNEILTVHPKKYGDAQLIAETFREGIPVIINLTQMSESEARRLVDFASGLSQGLRGHIERVTANVFLLSPSHVMVSGEGDGLESELDASLTD
jgi:cell division inhibitor SepF